MWGTATRWVGVATIVRTILFSYLMLLCKLSGQISFQQCDLSVNYQAKTWQWTGIKTRETMHEALEPFVALSALQKAVNEKEAYWWLLTFSSSENFSLWHFNFHVNVIPEPCKWDAVHNESSRDYWRQKETHMAHPKALATWEVFFSTVCENDGTFWFFNLEKDSVRNVLLLWNFQNRLSTNRNTVKLPWAGSSTSWCARGLSSKALHVCLLGPEGRCWMRPTATNCLVHFRSRFLKFWSSILTINCSNQPWLKMLLYVFL